MEEQPITYQQECKLQRLSQAMDQIRFVHGHSAQTGETFDYLYDMSAIELDNFIRKYEAKVTEKADPNLRKAAEIAKLIDQCKDSIKSFSDTNDADMVRALVKNRDELIDQWKRLTKRTHYS